MKCSFCKAERKDKISYECGTLDNDPHPRTYKCALNAWYYLKEIINIYTSDNLNIYDIIKLLKSMRYDG